MKRLECAPRTEAWYTIRAESWTASQAAMLVVRENAEMLRDYAATKGVTLDIVPLLAVGLESYFENTPWKCWAEKMGRIPRFAGNAHTERGQANEVRVLDHFIDNQMIMVEKDVTALSSEHPWLLASFDSVALPSSDVSAKAPHGFPVEAKCPAFQSRRKLWEAKKTKGMAILGLPYYWCQVQHQILVANAPYGYFVAAGIEPDKDGVEQIVFPIVEKVPRDDAFLTAYLAVAKFYFEEFIYEFVEPPKLPTDIELLKKLEDAATFDKAMLESDHETAVDMYFEAVAAEEAAKARRAELEAKVLTTAKSMRAEGSDVVLLADRLEVTWSRSATMSWQKAAKQMAKDAGLSDIPPAVIAACTGKEKEGFKLKEKV